MIKGVIFSTIFNHKDNMSNIGLKSMDEINILLVFFGQIVRGVLLGIVIWWIKDSIIGKKFGWLKLWAILVILDIISVYAPAPASIEGLLYLVPDSFDIPLAFMLGSIGEILVQPLTFSIIVTYQGKKKNVK
jgi:hypothetical protein